MVRWITHKIERETQRINLEIENLDNEIEVVNVKT